MSDSAIIEMMGSFIKETRIRQNKTQQQLALDSGIHRFTIVQFENGKGGNLRSLVQILRQLDQLHLFKSFEIIPQISPLELARIEQHKRRRASTKTSYIDSKQPPKKSNW